jgi:hypothetical protein
MADQNESNIPQVSPYRELQFDGDQLVAVVIEGDGVAVPVRLICQALGLDIGSQSERLQEHEVLSQGLRIVRIRQGRQLRPVVALLHRYIPFWLATIAPSQVGPNVRPKLVRYQTELVDILAALYGADPQPLTPSTADSTLASLQQAMAAALTELRLTREAILALQHQQATQDQRIIDQESRVENQAQQIEAHQRQLTHIEGVVDDMLTQLAHHTTITGPQQEVISRAIKRLATRYKRKHGQEIFGRLFAQFCMDFGTPKYGLLPAGKYDAALDWLRHKALELLPDDPEALPPLQEALL